MLPKAKVAAWHSCPTMSVIELLIQVASSHHYNILPGKEPQEPWLASRNPNHQNQTCPNQVAIECALRTVLPIYSNINIFKSKNQPNFCTAVMCNVSTCKQTEPHAMPRDNVVKPSTGGHISRNLSPVWCEKSGVCPNDKTKMEPQWYDPAPHTQMCSEGGTQSTCWRACSFCDHMPNYAENDVQLESHEPLTVVLNVLKSLMANTVCPFGVEKPATANSSPRLCKKSLDFSAISWTSLLTGHLGFCCLTFWQSELLPKEFKPYNGTYWTPTQSENNMKQSHLWLSCVSLQSFGTGYSNFIWVTPTMKVSSRWKQWGGATFMQLHNMAGSCAFSPPCHTMSTHKEFRSHGDSNEPAVHLPEGTTPNPWKVRCKHVPMPTYTN